MLVFAIFLIIPFLVPVSIPGVSTVFGLLITLIGVGVMTNRMPWLPQRLMDRRVRTENLARAFEHGSKLVARLERFLHPRLSALTRSGGVNRFNGLMVVVAGLLLMVPLGFVPFSSTLPGLAILFLAVGMLQKDGVSCFWATSSSSRRSCTSRRSSPAPSPRDRDCATSSRAEASKGTSGEEGVAGARARRLPRVPGRKSRLGDRRSGVRTRRRLGTGQLGEQVAELGGVAAVVLVIMRGTSESATRPNPIPGGRGASSLRRRRRAGSRGSSAAHARTRVSPSARSRSRVDALARRALPVEVRQGRVLLGQDAPDADAVAFALQVGEMPDVLDEGEPAVCWVTGASAPGTTRTRRAPAAPVWIPGSGTGFRAHGGS